VDRELLGWLQTRRHKTTPRITLCPAPHQFGRGHLRSPPDAASDTLMIALSPSVRYYIWPLIHN
jgi:hypothetical protein